MTASWLVRAGALLAGFALVVVLVVAVAVVAETGTGPDELAAGEVDALVALVGGQGRLAAAEAVQEQTGGALVISNRAPEHDGYARGERAERCAAADGDDVACFRPEPHATRGEARAIGELVEKREWERVVVVTDRYHLRRSGLPTRQCAPDADVELVAADDSLSRTACYARRSRWARR